VAGLGQKQQNTSAFVTKNVLLSTGRCNDGLNHRDWRTWGLPNIASFK
jgi:hypothetical protein